MNCGAACFDEASGNAELLFRSVMSLGREPRATQECDEGKLKWLPEQPRALSMLQVMVKPLGMGAIFRPKSGKDEWFRKLVLGTESLTGHNLHQ